MPLATERAGAGRSLRVVHVVSPQPRGDAGGADRQVADLAVAQQRTGHVLPLVVEMGDKGYAATLEAAGVPARTIVHPYARTAIGELRRAVRDHGADVLHSHGYDADVLAGLAHVARWPRRRSVWVATVHGFVSLDARSRRKTALDRVVLRWGPAAVTTSSAAAARRLRPRRSPAHPVPNGVARPDAPGDGPARGAGPLAVLVIGRLSPEKRPTLAVEACGRAARSVPVRLTVAGTGPEADAVRGRVADAGLADRVRLTGFVAEVEPLYRDADVVLLLSSSEGTPRVVLEAMARGLPVVATAVGGVGAAVEDGVTGVLVDPAAGRAVTEAARALIALAGDPARRAAMGSAAAARYEAMFTLDRMEERIAAVYGSALTRRTVSWP